MFKAVLFDELWWVLGIDLKRGEVVVVHCGERVLDFDARGLARFLRVVEREKSPAVLGQDKAAGYLMSASFPHLVEINQRRGEKLPRCTWSLSLSKLPQEASSLEKLQ